MTEPTTAIPDWASDANYSTGVDAGVSTKLAMQPEEIPQGVRAGKFAARKFNWLVRTITDWLSYFKTAHANFVDGGTYSKPGTEGRIIQLLNKFGFYFGDGSAQQGVTFNCGVTCQKPPVMVRGCNLGQLVLSPTSDTWMDGIPFIVYNEDYLSSNHKLRITTDNANEGFFFVRLWQRSGGTQHTLIVTDWADDHAFPIEESATTDRLVLFRLAGGRPYLICVIK